MSILLQELVTVMDVYGHQHKVSRSDYDGDRTMLPIYDATGRRRFGNPLHRANISCAVPLKTWRYYVGVNPGRRDIFAASETPTEDSHGKRWVCAIGPFRTLRGAAFMAVFGEGNPHCRCVDDAERLGRIQEQDDRQCKAACHNWRVQGVGVTA